MSIIKIIDAFAFYGLDVCVLAAINCALVQLLKVTVLKRCQKKIVTFAPFIFGCVLYAVYFAVRNLSVTMLLESYVSVLEHGLSVGALSTVAYVWYEQFIRENRSVPITTEVIRALIDGYVPPEGVDEVAAQIAEAIGRDVTGDGAKKTAEILAANCGGELNENDVKLLAKLIIETLANLSANA